MHQEREYNSDSIKQTIDFKTLDLSPALQLQLLKEALRLENASITEQANLRLQGKAASSKEPCKKQ